MEGQSLMEPWMWWASFCVVLATIAWKASAWWKEHTMKHARIDEVLAEIKDDLKSLKDDFKALKDDFKALKDDFKSLKDDFRRLIGSRPQVALSDSPMRLSELGEKVSLCVDAKVLAEDLAPRIVGGLTSINPYDIQSFCKSYFKEEHKLSDEQEDTFKQCAYDHGIKLEQVQFVCAIELRDELLRLIEERQ